MALGLDSAAVEVTTGARTLRNHVGGRWVEAAESAVLEDVDPATGEVAALVPRSGAADVDAAVTAATAAQAGWAEVPPQERARAVMALRETLVAHRSEIAALITADMGKTIADADGEVGRGIESVEAAAAIPHLLKGETLDGVSGGVDVATAREPVGVVAAITPFNFPVMIPLWFLPFAIATGNSIVLKPSERDPRPAERIFELLDETGALPPGVANLVHGDRAAVEALLAHPDVDAISFVGQASTARLVARAAIDRGVRAQALGGAKNSLVVMPDAELDRAVPAILASAFGAAGQRCLAGSVCVLVGDRRRQDEVREALAAAAADLAVGPGADPQSDVCPMVGADARERAEVALERALSAGSELVLDGRIGGGETGTYLRPTIVEPADRESEIAREELFGPVLALVRADDLEDALSFVNGSRYGNAGAVFTTSGAAARAYRRGVEAGMVGINVGGRR